MNYGKKLPLLAREITMYPMHVYCSYDSRAGNETKSKIPIYVSIQRKMTLPFLSATMDFRMQRI